MRRNILGPRIRERRRDLGITQAELARNVEISASYLNLIEHNKRDIGGVLLRKVAQVLDVPLDQLDGAADRRLLETLDDIAQSPELRSLGVEASSAGELIGRFPGWARGVAALSRSERRATNIASVLGDRMRHDPFLSETVHKMLTRIASLRSAAEIVEENPDIEADRRERFYAIIHDESRHLSELGDALAAFFDNAALAKRRLTPLDEIDDLFDRRENHFAEIEDRAEDLHAQLPAGAANARLQAAEEIVERELDDLINAIIAEEASLETEMARVRTRKTLQRYAVGAVILPLEDFSRQARESHYDIEQLADNLAVDYELVCERLSALPRADDRPCFGYFLANASGTIRRSRNLPGLSVVRYGSACPLWVLYRAQQSPYTVWRQHVQIPSGESFVFVARARVTGAVGFDQPRHYLTDMVLLSDRDAAHTVYSPDRSTPTEPVGVSCRSCPRRNCIHRVSDPLAG